VLSAICALHAIIVNSDNAVKVNFITVLFYEQLEKQAGSVDPLPACCNACYL